MWKKLGRNKEGIAIVMTPEEYDIPEEFTLEECITGYAKTFQEIFNYRLFNIANGVLVLFINCIFLFYLILGDLQSDEITLFWDFVIINQILWFIGILVGLIFYILMFKFPRTTKTYWLLFWFIFILNISQNFQFF